MKIITQQRSFPDKYRALLAAFLFVFISITATAQYDSTKVRQQVQAYGFSWKNGEFRHSLVIPKSDTVPTAVADSGSMVYKNGIIYLFDGTQWNAFSASPTPIDTANKWVNNIYRTAGVDSIYFQVGSTIYAVKDSTGSGGGSTNTSVGSGFPVAITGTNNVKELTEGWGVLWDTAVANNVRATVDTAADKVATQTMLGTKLNKADSVAGGYYPYSTNPLGYLTSPGVPTLVATRLGYGDGSNLLTGSSTLTFAVGTGIVTAPKLVINTTVDAGGATDAAVIINRTLNVANNGHGFKDYTSITNDATSYATFDAQVEMASTGATDHNVAFQGRHIINKGAGVLSNNWGFLDITAVLSPITTMASFQSQPYLYTGAAVSNRMGLRIREYEGAVSLVSNTYGIWFDALTKATGDNYGMYDNGSNKHYLSDIRAGSRLNVGSDALADSSLTVINGIWGKRGVRFSGLPTGVGTKAVRIDANGTLSIADTTTGAGNNIYNNDGTIPTATARVMNIAGTGSLQIFHLGNSNEIHIEGGSGAGVGDIEIDAEAGNLNLSSPSNNVNVFTNSFKTVRSADIKYIADSASWFMKIRNKTSGLEADAYWPAGGSGADALGTYLVQTATNAPANAQVMGALGTGIVKNTTITGVQSIAVAGDFPTLDQNTTGSAASLTTTRTIWGQNFNGTANVTGLLALGANDLTMTGSIAATGARVTKGWFTDVESTNMYSVGGTSLSSTFQGLDADLTTIAGLTATSDNFMIANSSAWASRTPTQATALLINVVGDAGAGGTKGLVPAPAAGDAAANKFLKADGTWTAIAGGGDMVLASVQSVTGAKTFDKDKILMKGTSTGVTTWSTANTGASNYTFETPAANITAAQLTKLTTSTSANTASTIAERDANNMLALNNVSGTYATTATAAGTTTLTVGSKYEQYFTGVTTQTVTMPDATTLTVGMGYRIVNNSTGIVTVNKNGGTLIKAVAAGQELFVQVTDISSAAGVYSTGYSTDLAVGNGTATNITFAAGTTSVSPINMASGTLKTTPADGDIEMNGDAMYATTDAGNRGAIPAVHFIRADATRTYTSNTSSQTIFNSPANGALTLETGVYEFEGLLLWTAMSATSGNRSVDILGAGTATTAAWAWVLCGIDNSTLSSLVDDDCPALTTSGSAASCVTAGTGTGLRVRVKGTFEVTGAGTLIPSTTMVTAAASVLSIGSIFKCWRIGSTSAVSVGEWN